MLPVTGCFYQEYDPGVIPEGELFYTNSPVKFFFIDENGEDLMHEEDTSTYPLAYPSEVPQDSRDAAFRNIKTIMSDGLQLTLYNDGINMTWVDPETGRQAFQTCLWGISPRPSYKTYIYAGNGWKADSLNVEYRYLSGKETESGSWAVEVTSMQYNGVEVFKDNGNKQVYIIKPSEGGTVVHVGNPGLGEEDAE